jgi:hypothetical protein
MKQQAEAEDRGAHPPALEVWRDALAFDPEIAYFSSAIVIKMTT